MMFYVKLTWFLRSNNLLSNLQMGFSAKRSTIDQIVCLEILIREAFFKKEHLVAVFLDFEKAYDMSWPYGILKDRGLQNTPRFYKTLPRRPNFPNTNNTFSDPKLHSPVDWDCRIH